MKTRILGFDLARAYSIFGMYIVNYNIVFGNYRDTKPLSQFLTLFSGNSSTVFVILAGMGLSLMTNRENYTSSEKTNFQKVVHKRSLFLFFLGLALYTWWPADILHFYGGYMHIAAIVLFWPKKIYLWIAAGAVAIFHILFFTIPYDIGWNFETLTYNDFWTVQGFIRNTIYNGWNSIFPWLAYFLIGMYLGRLDWEDKRTSRNIFTIGAIAYILVEIVQYFAKNSSLGEMEKLFFTSEYIPPFLPFQISTIGFGFMIISLFIRIAKRYENNSILQGLATTGQMTLTHYISHLTLGMLLFSAITGKKYEMQLNRTEAIPPEYILAFAISYFLISYIFSIYWKRKFANGPLELLMRKVSG